MKHWMLLVGLVLVATSATARDCGPGLKKELLARLAADQSARKALTAAPASVAAVLRTDADNTAFMHSVLAACAWPKQSVVGAEAAEAAWLLTQHADMDPEFQVAAARQLKYAVLGKEAKPWNLAVLVDRNRRLSNQPQVYGMQFFREEGGPIRFVDIVTPAQLDSRRKEIGLPSFYCWAHQVSSMNDGAPIEWPAGVLLQPEQCPAAP